MKKQEIQSNPSPFRHFHPRVHPKSTSYGASSLDSLSQFTLPGKGKNLKGFTLVELIVVTTILAILGTIAFISLQGYSRDARDSARVSDMSRIKTSLELYNIEAGKYPDPTEAQPITFSGGLAWYQGIFGNSTFINVSKLDKIPKDPITDKEYSYSVLNTGQEYELGGIMEGDEISMNIEKGIMNNVASSPMIHVKSLSGIGVLRGTSAAEKTTKAKISGTYNGLSLRVNVNNTSYILAIPSITSSIDLSVENNRKLEIIIPSKEVVLTNYKNLPSNYVNSTYNSNPETTNTEFEVTNGNNISSVILFEGDVQNLTTLEFITKLQEAYSGTSVISSRGTNELLTANLSNSVEMEKLDSIGVTFINRHLGGSSQMKIYNTCNGIAHNTTKSYYTGTGVTFTEGDCDGLKQNFICKDGIWKNGETVLDTNTYAYETCTVGDARACTHLSTEINHGDNLTVYSQASILWNATQECSDTGIQGTVTCNDGTVTGDTGFAHKICAKGTPNNCLADTSYDNEGGLLQTYNVPGLNHGQTHTGYVDISENNGIFRYSLNAICNDGELNPAETGPEIQSCNQNYNIVGNTCVANTQTYTCASKPANGSWNTVSSYTQTWNGTAWLPVNTTTSYNTSASTTECRYTCDSGYYNNGGTSCDSQWTGNSTTGYLFKNTSGVEQYPLNCNDLLDKSTWKNTLAGSPWNGSVFTSGVYWIKPNASAAFKVYCDMTNSSGGWTLLSNVVSYDGTNVYNAGTACTSTSTNCGGDLVKLGNSTLDYTKVKIVHQNGKYVIFNLKNGGNFENIFSNGTVYNGLIDPYYIIEDNIYTRSGYTDNFIFWSTATGNTSLWLANNSVNTNNWSSYGFKWNSNCASVGYSTGLSSCVNSGGFSIYVKKDIDIPLGQNSTFPAKSCKAIRDAGYSTGNGVYWIKPDANAAFQVYCDMTTNGGGWTLVRKMKNDTIVSASTTANNASSLTTLTTASANLADTTWNAINPTQVWNICNGYQTIYNRNMATAWYSNHGVTDNCGYNRNFWTSMQKNFGSAEITAFTHQSCGGGYSTVYSSWGIITGIHASSAVYFGCYDSFNGANTTSAAPAAYDNRLGTAIGWGGNGYVLVR
ncbi:MAG: fibrinogen-like YCDxxxxGGGW domain-containing protein [Candidatus Gracilibacteria bacterium]|nr:fibrinogen-like YCDxxxxGGGW domain-containing protein [Candidatus Gracilibacteria bacterium]